MSGSAADQIGSDDACHTPDKAAEVPVFDDFHKQQIRSLRDAMLDFAQSIGSGKNFLYADLASKEVWLALTPSEGVKSCLK